MPADIIPTTKSIAAKNTQRIPQATRSTGEQKLPSRRLVRKSRRLSYGFSEYGYIYPDGVPIPKEYLVRITSYRLGSTVVAPIQEDIALGVESLWEPIIPSSILRTANIFVQATKGGKRSAITSSTTRRLWSGTSPMGVSLRLRFEAVKDPYHEVVEPCRLLQTMAVPSDPSTGRNPVNFSEIASDMKRFKFGKVGEAISNFPGLVPPGPSPFTWSELLSGQINYTEKNQQDFIESAHKGDFIIVELGTFLTFWNVIIREDSIVYKTKFSEEGYPISAEAEIRFETYEMPTKESLEYSYTTIVPTGE